MIYIVQGRFTREAMVGMVAKPEDRYASVNKLAKSVGAKIVCYYFTFGEYDFLLILDGPDQLKMLPALIVAGSTGGVSDLKTTIGVTTAEAKQAFTTAGGLVKSFHAAAAA